MVDLSIIIVNWNTKPLTRQCLRSIYSESCRMRFEVFVVDEASFDGSVTMIKLEFPQVKLVKNKRQIGFSKANNQAIRVSKGRYVLLLNSDTVVNPGVLEKMIGFMDGHKDVGALMPKLIYPNGKIQRLSGAIPTIGNTILRYLFPLKMYDLLMGTTRLKKKKKIGEGFEVDGITGASMVVRREVFKQIGLFDEEMALFAEDTDLSYRIKKAGWKLCCLPDVSIIHMGGGSYRHIPIEARTMMYKARWAFFKKHFSYKQAIFVKVLVGLSAFIKLLTWLLMLFVLKQGKKIAKNNLKAYLNILKWVFKGRNSRNA